MFVPQGIGQLRKYLVDRVEDGNNELAGPARQTLMRGWAQWQALDMCTDIDAIERLPDFSRVEHRRLALAVA